MGIRSTWLGDYYANLDGTDEVSETVVCSDYTDKNFLYYSLHTGEVIDREPAAASWDILFTKYSEAPVTTLVVKDRVAGHNPVSVLYGQNFYYKRLQKQPIMPDVK